VIRVQVSAQGIDTPAWLPRLKRFAQTALVELGIDGQEISIVLCDDEFIRALNRDYRGKDYPTDVLSFAQREDEEALDGRTAAGGRSRSRVEVAGDVVISLPMVRANAKRFGVDEDEELKRLLIHGILHLQGMDHKTNGEHEPMIELQERVLRVTRGEPIT